MRLRAAAYSSARARATRRSASSGSMPCRRATSASGRGVWGTLVPSQLPRAEMSNQSSTSGASSAPTTAVTSSGVQTKNLPSTPSESASVADQNPPSGDVISRST